LDGEKTADFHYLWDEKAAFAPLTPIPVDSVFPQTLKQV
jgi:hypothetical protein